MVQLKAENLIHRLPNAERMRYMLRYKRGFNFIDRTCVLYSFGMTQILSSMEISVLCWINLCGKSLNS